MIEARHIIFLPVRNGGQYLQKAIDSVIAQTCSEWHLVVLENASTDSTAAMVARYTDRRITIIPALEPLTMHQNWDRGRALLKTGQITGQFATFIGHDDLFYPDFLAQIDALIAADPGATLYQVLFDMIDGEGRLLRPCRPIPAAETWDGFAAALCWGMRDSFGTGYVFRCEDYIRVGGIPDLPMLLCADDLLFLRLTQAGHKASTSASGCAYRLHRSSTSGTISAARINAHICAIEIFIRALMEEFAPFVSRTSGTDAIASLIAREVAVYDGGVIRKALTVENRARMDWLLEQFERYARGVPISRWIGSNFITTTFYMFSRRIYLSLVLLRQRAKGWRRSGS